MGAMQLAVPIIWQLVSHRCAVDTALRAAASATTAIACGVRHYRHLTHHHHCTRHYHHHKRTNVVVALPCQATARPAVGRHGRPCLHTLPPLHHLRACAPAQHLDLTPQRPIGTFAPY
eukprot:363807-Chlamydomonas_euryale.AAC.7